MRQLSSLHLQPLTASNQPRAPGSVINVPKLAATELRCNVRFPPIADIHAPDKLTCMGSLFLQLVAVFQTASPYPADMDCSNSGDGSPYSMNQCVYSQSQEWDRRLNIEYRAAMKRVEVDKAKLRASQWSWLRYREANCDLYGAVRGSDGKLLANACWRDMTRARTLELREMRWTG